MSPLRYALLPGDTSEQEPKLMPGPILNVLTIMLTVAALLIGALSLWVEALL